MRITRSNPTTEKNRSSSRWISRWLPCLALLSVAALSTPAAAGKPLDMIDAASPRHDLRGKTVLVTGANRGIGLALCKALSRRGARVIATVQKSSKALDALAQRRGEGKMKIITGIDVTKIRTVKSLTRSLSSEKLDLLINVAGVIRPPRSPGKPQSQAAMLKEYAVNALGPKNVVEALDKNLRPGAKIAMITSQWGSIAESLEGKVPQVSTGYSMSKAALNMYGASLAVQVKERKISVGLLNPGWVRTRMGGKNGELSPEQAAEKLLSNIGKIKLDNSGTFWDINGQHLPW